MRSSLSAEVKVWSPENTRDARSCIIVVDNPCRIDNGLACVVVRRHVESILPVVDKHAILSNSSRQSLRRTPAGRVCEQFCACSRRRHADNAYLRGSAGNRVNNNVCNMLRFMKVATPDGNILRPIMRCQDHNSQPPALQRWMTGWRLAGRINNPQRVSIFALESPIRRRPGGGKVSHMIHKFLNWNVLWFSVGGLSARREIDPINK